MGKYLKLTFENAGLFRDSHKSFVMLDKSKNFSDKNARKKRREHFHFEEPIAPNHIINMIHVLFGQRPKPSFRNVGQGLQLVEYYEKKALDSFLRIESFKSKNVKTGKEYYPEEIMSLKKDTHNAWNPNTVIYWERIKKLLYNEKLENANFLYDEFVRILNKTFKTKSIEVIPFDEVKEMILNLKQNNFSSYKENIVPLFDFLRENKKAPVESYILNDFHDIDKNSRTVLLVNKYVNKVTRLKGTILVPIDESDIEMLKQCSGYATLLDGGLVKIKEIIGEHQNTSDSSGYTKVSDLSKKTIPFKKEQNENQN